MCIPAIFFLLLLHVGGFVVAEVVVPAEFQGGCQGVDGDKILRWAAFEISGVPYDSEEFDGFFRSSFDGLGWPLSGSWFFGAKQHEANLNDLIERSVELCLHASQGGSGTDKGHGSRQLDPAVPAALPSPAKETTASPPSPPSESTTSQPCPPCSPQSFPPPVTCKPQLPCPTLLPDLQSTTAQSSEVPEAKFGLSHLKEWVETNGEKTRNMAVDQIKSVVTNLSSNIQQKVQDTVVKMDQNCESGGLLYLGLTFVACLGLGIGWGLAGILLLTYDRLHRTDYVSSCTCYQNSNVGAFCLSMSRACTRERYFMTTGAEISRPDLEILRERNNLTINVPKTITTQPKLQIETMV